MKGKLLKNDVIIEMIAKANRSSSLTDRQAIYSEIFLGTKKLSEMHTKRWKTCPSYSDLVMVGNLALYNAIITFDPIKCPRFYGWAAPWIKKDLARETFRIKKHYDVIDQATDYYEVAKSCSDDLNPETILLAKERTNILKKSILCLDPITARLIASSFEIDGLGLGKHDAGLSDYQKSRLRKAAIKSLQNDAQLCKAIE